MSTKTDSISVTVRFRGRTYSAAVLVNPDAPTCRELVQAGVLVALDKLLAEDFDRRDTIC